MTQHPQRTFVTLAQLGLLACWLTGALTGCVAKAAEDRKVMPGDELLEQAGVDEQGAWQSAPWTRSLWIPYPGGGSVEIFHGLGRVPTSVQVYISGEPDDRDRETKQPRHAYAGAGNIVTITGVTEDSVSVDNNTAGDFYIRLVVQ